MIPIHPLARMQLQAVERALAGQRRAPGSLGLKLTQQRPEHRIVPQLLVIVEILVPQRHPKHPLPDQRPHRVFDQLRVALIDEAPSQPIDQPDRLIRAPQQQRSGVRAHRPSVEPRHHTATLHA